MRHIIHVRDKYNDELVIGSAIFDDDTNCVGVTLRAIGDQHNRRTARERALLRLQYAQWVQKGVNGRSVTICAPLITHGERNPKAPYMQFNWRYVISEVYRLIIEKARHQIQSFEIVCVGSNKVEESAQVLGFVRE